jgi:hypothetical protein
VPLQMMAYFDKRIKTTTWVEHYIRGKVENLPDCDFNITCEGMWNDKIDHEIERSMFQEDTIENPLSMKIFDMPACLRFNSETALNLLEVLATTENIEILENKSLRAIIEYKFPVIRKAIVQRMFRPYILMLALFMIYSIWSYEYFQSEEGKIAEKKKNQNFDRFDYSSEYYFVIV